MTHLAARLTFTRGLAALLVLLFGSVTAAEAQKVSVTSATPSEAPRGTSNLDVRLGGRGFEPGAQAYFYVSNTSDPGGITVKSTTYVSSTEVVARIDIASDAVLSLFDIVVANPDVRSGKGGDLFRVTESTARSGGGCTLEPIASPFALAAELNDPIAPQYGNALGVGSMLAAGTWNSQPVLVAAVATRRESRKMEFFILDPTTGLPSVAHPHRTVTIPLSPENQAVGGFRAAASGDVNGDGIPEFLIGDTGGSGAALFVGRLDPDGLNWSGLTVPRASGLASFGSDVFLGDIDGDGRDEVVVGKTATGSGKRLQPGAVYVYAYQNGGLTLTETITHTSIQPSLKTDDGFGWAVALADVAGDSQRDLIVGLHGREVTGLTDVGVVLVLERTGSGTTARFDTNAIELRPSIIASGSHFGYRLSVGQIADSTAPDIVATTAWNTNSAGEVFVAPVSPGQVGTLRFVPRPGLYGGWSTNRSAIGDVNGDGLADIVVGAPNVGDSGSCTSPGMAYLFLGTGTADTGVTGWQRTTVQAPTPDVDFAGFGWSVATAHGYPFVIVGEHGRGDQQSGPPGQAYVFSICPASSCP